MNPKIRVLVIEDSLTVRKRLLEVLGSDPGFEVVGEGADGKDAIELCQRLRPDVITMDMMMPMMTGLAATEYIMAYCPTPILIVSASVNRGDALRTLDALAAGAVDVLDKPSGDEDDGRWERRFLSTLRMISRIKVITHPRAKLAKPLPGIFTAPASTIPDSGLPIAAAAAQRYRLLAIGASTGGPQAMMQLLPALAADFALPILLVLHLDARFQDSFRDWLDGLSGLPVEHARDGMPLPLPGDRRVILAPGDRHLVVEGGRLRLLDTPERNSCKPSVDVLFESLAREGAASTIACLLTGMGRDGAAGLLALRRAGAATIAQDEASCVVFGMPAEAIKLGAAQLVLPLSQIAAQVTGLSMRLAA